jgi:hypothetical protein
MNEITDLSKLNIQLFRRMIWNSGYKLASAVSNAGD